MGNLNSIILNKQTWLVLEISVYKKSHGTKCQKIDHPKPEKEERSLPQISTDFY